MWKSLLYSIPHFCAFVKLKYDFNRFVRFFLKKNRRLHRSAGAAVGETSRARHQKNAPVTVARGPVPRDRSIYRSARACPSRSFIATTTAGDRPPPYGRRAPPPIGQDRLILTRLRSGDRNLQRGSARACPARAANHAPITVARGPVPRELSSRHKHGGGQAPALR